MKAKHPLYVRGEVVTEFSTDEQHARELEKKGFAERVEVRPGSVVQAEKEAAEAAEKAVSLAAIEQEKITVMAAEKQEVTETKPAHVAKKKGG